MNLLAYAVVERGQGTVVHMLRDDGFAARRQFVDNRDVEVAIERHCERAGNRCCRHDEHVGRVCAFVPKFGTLGNAKAVLFVDNHKT